MPMHSLLISSSSVVSKCLPTHDIRQFRLFPVNDSIQTSICSYLTHESSFMLHVPTSFDGFFQMKWHLASREAPSLSYSKKRTRNFIPSTVPFFVLKNRTLTNLILIELPTVPNSYIDYATTDRPLLYWLS